MSKPRGIIAAVLLGLTNSPLSLSATNYQDWWWNSAQSGQGVNIGQQGNTLFASWFTYDQTGAGMFLTVAGNLLNNKVTGDLIRTTGPALGTTFNPNQVTRTIVGQGALTFSDANNGVLQYTVNGISGNLVITRFSFATLNPAGSYIGGGKTSRSGCTLLLNNGVFEYGAEYNITTNANSLNIQEQFASGSCSYAGTYIQNGSKISASGPFSCSSGTNGTWVAKDILVLDDALLASNVSVQFTSGETCQGTSTLGGIKLN